MPLKVDRRSWKCIVEQSVVIKSSDKKTSSSVVFFKKVVILLLFSFARLHRLKSLCKDLIKKVKERSR